VRLPSLRPLTQMTSERCDRDVWTGTFAHKCSVNHSWSNLGERVQRCVEVALDLTINFTFQFLIHISPNRKTTNHPNLQQSVGVLDEAIC
jgi:hypothetical protein